MFWSQLFATLKPGPLNAQIPCAIPWSTQAGNGSQLTLKGRVGEKQVSQKLAKRPRSAPVDVNAVRELVHITIEELERAKAKLVASPPAVGERADLVEEVTDRVTKRLVPQSPARLFGLHEKTPGTMSFDAVFDAPIVATELAKARATAAGLPAAGKTADR